MSINEVKNIFAEIFTQVKLRKDFKELIEFDKNDKIDINTYQLGVTDNYGTTIYNIKINLEEVIFSNINYSYRFRKNIDISIKVDLLIKLNKYSDELYKLIVKYNEDFEPYEYEILNI